jgi:hypothetical protein
LNGSAKRDTRIYTGSGLHGVIPYVQFVLFMLFALVCSGTIQTSERERDEFPSLCDEEPRELFFNN